MSDVLPIEADGVHPPAAPRLRGAVVLRRDRDGAIDALLADVFLHAQNCVRAFGDFHLAVGGAIGLEPALVRLMVDLAYREFPWSRTRLWLAEEIGVPEGDERRVAPWLKELIVEPSGMPADQFHAMDPSVPSAGEAMLREHLGWRPKGQDRLDLVLLAMNDRGAVVRAGLGAGEGLVGPSTCEDGTPAATLTPGAVNAARLTCVLACGPGCRGPLSRLDEAMRLAPPRREPLQGLRLKPVGGGELRWYVDHEACAHAAPSGPT